MERNGRESTPTPAGSVSDNEPLIPTIEEMLSLFSAQGAGIQEKVVRSYHAWHAERDTWLIKNGRGQLIVRPWKTEVLRWQANERRPASGGGSTDLGEELENINAELQGLDGKNEKHKARIDQLMKRYWEIKTLLGD
jgi:hypothetical protein